MATGVFALILKLRNDYVSIFKVATFSITTLIVYYNLEPKITQWQERYFRNK